MLLKSTATFLLQKVIAQNNIFTLNDQQTKIKSFIKHETSTLYFRYKSHCLQQLFYYKKSFSKAIFLLQKVIAKTNIFIIKVIAKRNIFVLNYKQIRIKKVDLRINNFKSLIFDNTSFTVWESIVWEVSMVSSHSTVADTTER